MSDNIAEGARSFDTRPFNEGDLPLLFPVGQGLDYPVLLTKLNDPEYRIGSGTRGKCVIFDYKVFQGHTNLRARPFSDENVQRVSLQFRDLGYEVIIHRELTRKRTLEELEKLGNENYSQDDSFVCWIMTHGGENGCLYTVDGGKLTEDHFVRPFGEKEDLRGKPKLFFIEACRGHRVDKGQYVVLDSSDFNPQTCRIPKCADFLVAYSTVPGFQSMEDVPGGSWFVRAVSWVLENSNGSEDLLALLTVACRLIALHCEAHTPGDPHTDGAKQVPHVTSTLTRRVRLPKRRQT